jgi:hypothetical protein
MNFPTPGLALTSYNCCSARQAGRLEDIVKAFRVHSDIFCLQGTRLPACNDELLWTQKINDFYIYQWGYAVRERNTNRACGVSIGIKYYMLPYVRQLFSPPASLAGRAGAVRVHWQSRDYCFITLYCPVNTGLANDIETMKLLMKWLNNLLCILPERCIPVLGTDGNMKLGLQTDGHPSDSRSVGTCDPFKENFNGSQFREIADKHSLAFTNTHLPAGRTYYHASGASTKPDSILVPLYQLCNVTKLATLVTESRSLQAIPSSQPRDHFPLWISFNFPPPSEARIRSVHQWDRDCMMQNWLQCGIGRANLTSQMEVWAEDHLKVPIERTEENLNKEWETITDKIQLLALGLFGQKLTLLNILQIEVDLTCLNNALARE